MTPDVETTAAWRSLLIKIPSHSSASSAGSATSSPSQGSFPQHQTAVKFAPLPAISPTRRRSPRPMGVAGRAAHMRRRGGPRTYRDHELGDYRHQRDCWEDDRHETRRMAKGGKRRHEPGGVAGDPLLLLGRLVRNASQGLWKSVAKRRPKERREKRPSNAFRSTDSEVVVLDISSRKTTKKVAEEVEAPIEHVEEFVDDEELCAIVVSAASESSMMNQIHVYKTAPEFKSSESRSY